MKKMMTMIMVAVVCLGASTVWADEIDITGYSHNLVVGAGQTVNVLSGADIDGYILVYAEGVLNVKVGNGTSYGTAGGPTIYQDAQVNLYSGIIPASEVGGGELNIYGGVLEDVSFYGTTGVINVYGSDFALDGEDIIGTFELSSVTGHLLSGTLSTGEALNLLIKSSYSGNSVTINLMPAATSPADMLANLGQFIDDEVTDGWIDAGLAVSLMAKINAASSALARGNPNDAKAAMNDLKALINQVEAQMDKKIDPITAQAIIDGANDVIKALGG